MTFLNSLLPVRAWLGQISFQEDSMKNGICFFGLPHPPTTTVGVCGKPAARLAAQTPMASRRLATLTLSEPSCYDVEAVREAPVQRLIS